MRGSGWMQVVHAHLRQTLILAAASVLAIWMGFSVADGNYMLPGLALALTVAAVLARLLKLPADVVLLGLAVFGYIVGNRGFAQLMPSPTLPILPAEGVLALALGWRLLLCALERRLPFRGDALDWAVLAWVVVGGIRFLFDFPVHGFLALRDFAMVYYALFYFVVRHMVCEPRARTYLIRCFIAGLLMLPVMFGLTHAFPEFFNSQLTLRGIPVFFYKPDLVYTIMGVGSVLLFFEGRNRAWMQVAAVLLGLGVAAGDNRASLLGLVVVMTGLMLVRHWRYPLMQGGALAGVLAVVVAGATLGEHAGLQQRLHGTYDRLRSVFDPQGAQVYESEESYFKGDNNLFRTVWWQAVIGEALEGNPVFGLGFGYNLASSFVMQYYPESFDDFTARSPHNIFLTIFGRMGLVGLATWVWLCLVMARRTWCSLRSDDAKAAWGRWSSLWVLLTSATFGVVLEGPMGAVIFWCLLGLAAGTPTEDPEASQADAQETAASAEVGLDVPSWQGELEPANR